MRSLLIEERDSGMFRVANNTGSVDVVGATLEGALVSALQQAGVFGGGEGVDVFRNSYSVALALESVMGSKESYEDFRHRTDPPPWGRGLAE